MDLRIIDRIKNKHFLSLAGNGIMSVLGMLNMMILYRALSVSDIGMWVFFLSILLLVDTFRSGFLTTAFIKFYAGASEERSKEVLGSAWYLAIIVTGILVLLNVPAYFFLFYIKNQSLAFFVEWFGIIYVASLPSFIATCAVQAEQRFDQLLYIRFCSQGIFILFVFFMVLTHTASLQNIIYAYLAGAAATSLLTIVMGWSRISSIKYRSKACVKELFNFGKFTVLTTLSSNLFGTSNTIIVNFMLGPAALAVFNLGSRLMEIIEIPLRSFAATGMPELSAAYNAGDKKKVMDTLKKYIGIITLTLLPVCISAAVLADVAIGILGGSKYVHSEAANIMRILMILALLYPLDRFFALTLDVIHQPQINFIKVFVMLAGSIAATFIGIYITGNIYGVAIGGIVPILIGVSVSKWALDRYYAFSFVSIYKEGYQQIKQLLATYWVSFFPK